MGVQPNEDRWCVVSQSLDVASVAANNSADQSFSLVGVRVGDFVQVSKPSLTAGLIISGARVSGPNTLTITFGNLTAAPIDPAAETYLIHVFRPEKTYTVRAVL